ncbi:MAG: phage major capsid protein [Syntrophorhabdaceae bacterium]
MQRTINELKAARAKAITQLQELAAKAAGRPLESDEQTTYSKLKAEIEDKDAKVKDLEKLAQEEDSTFINATQKEEMSPMSRYLRYGDVSGLAGGNIDINAAAAQLGLNVRGQDRTGFAPVVPIEYEKEIFKLAKESSLIMQLCRNMPMGSSSKEIPVGKDDTVAKWRAEKGLIEDSAGDLEKKTLKACNLYVLTKITNELIEDASIDVEAYTRENQAAVIGEAIDSKFFSNAPAVDGTSPKGLFDDMNKQALAGATLEYKDVAKLYMGLKQIYRKNGVFVATGDFITDVMTVTDETGRPIFVPSFGTSEPDRLFGKPLYESGQFGNVTVSSVNKEAVCVFADWSKIAYGNRRGVTVKRLLETYALNGQIGILSDLRLDACVVLKEATKVLHKK